MNHHLVYLYIVALVPKLAPPWGHMFYIGLYMEHIYIEPQNLESIYIYIGM